jgi:hypothetical protein
MTDANPRTRPACESPGMSRGNGVISKAGGKKLEAGSSRFYRVRLRVYGGLLLFVIAAGTPMATMPALRNRLGTRIHALKTAFTGEKSPVIVRVSENQEPFPAEYERPSPPPVAQILKIPAAPIIRSVPKREEAPAHSAPRRTLRIPPVGEPLPSADKGEESDEQSESVPAKDIENQPKYQQGTIEQEAYDLLKSNPAIAGLVQGSNPSLQFLSWDAASRGEDLYWVRLKFRLEGKTDVEYIWQVQLRSKRITPLNYNARTL